MKVKGSVFKSTLDFIKKNFGESGMSKVLSHLSTEDKTLLKLRISAALWYPFDLYINLSMAIEKEFGTGDLKLMRQIGGYSAESGLATGYKIIFRLGSPFYIVNIASKAYSMYFDKGLLEVFDEGDHVIKLKLHQIDKIHDFHLERVAGWMEKTFEMTGGKNPDVQIEEKNYEEKYVIFKGTWTD